MKVYRYNAKKREDRLFNQCGREKNPLNVKFYATNLDYAKKYEVIYNEDGEEIYKCDLEVVEVDANLFNMAENFKQLKSYNSYIAKEIGCQMRDYTRFINNAKKASERKMWANQIDNLKNREGELISTLIDNEFQTLSDFDNQVELVNELKSLGYNGYFTKNEIAIF